jgi:ABC-2 type transport system permease protein
MNRIWKVVRHETFVTVRRRAYLFMTFGVPIFAAIIVVAIILLQGNDEPESQNPLDKLPDRPIGYVDHSGLFDDPGELAGVILRYPDQDAAAADLRAGRLSSFYVISSDYMQSGHVTRRAPQLNLTESDTGVFQAFLILQLLGDENPALLLRLYQPARIIEHQLDARGDELSQIDEEERYGANFVLVYGFALILLFATLFPSNYLLRSVIEEKENRTIEVVLSSLRPLQLLAGKILGQGAMGLLQVFVWLASGWTLFNLASDELTALRGIELSLDKIAILLLYFLGGFMLMACLQAGIGAISTNMREGPQYSTFFILPMVIPLWLLSIFIETPNGGLATVLSLIPITAPLAMVQRIAITVVPWWQLGLSLTLLAAFVCLTLWLAAKIFRVNTLLAGTLPEPAELLKLLREA